MKGGRREGGSSEIPLRESLLRLRDHFRKSASSHLFQNSTYIRASRTTCIASGYLEEDNPYFSVRTGRYSLISSRRIALCPLLSFPIPSSRKRYSSNELFSPFRERTSRQKSRRDQAKSVASLLPSPRLPLPPIKLSSSSPTPAWRKAQSFPLLLPPLPSC